MLDYGREPVGAVGGHASEEWYRTQDVLLSSNAVAERVVTELGLERDPSFAKSAANAPSSARSEAARQLREQLSVTPVPQTHAVRVAVDDTRPERAARIANAIVEAYLQKAVEDRVMANQRALAWLNEQIGGTGQRLAETELQIQTYLERQEGPALAPEERLSLVTEEIKRLMQALTDTRLSRIELSARLAKLKGAVDASNPFDVRTQEIDASDEVKQLRTAYLALVLERERAAANATEGAPQVLGQEKLDALWGRMQSTLAGIVRSTQSELAALQQVETQLQSALDRANATGHSLRQRQLEYLRLSRERSEAEQWLKALRERTSSAGVALAAGTLSGRVIDPATVPLEPLPPRFMPGAPLGALVGLVLSSVIVALGRRRRVPLVQAVEAAPTTQQVAE